MSAPRPYLRDAATSRGFLLLNISYPICIAINIAAVIVSTVQHGSFQMLSIFNVLCIPIIIGMYITVLYKTAGQLEREAVRVERDLSLLVRDLRIERDALAERALPEHP